MNFIARTSWWKPHAWTGYMPTASARTDIAYTAASAIAASTLRGATSYPSSRATYRETISGDFGVTTITTLPVAAPADRAARTSDCSATATYCGVPAGAALSHFLMGGDLHIHVASGLIVLAAITRCDLLV